MKLNILPLEERIVLDAAAAVVIAAPPTATDSGDAATHDSSQATDSSQESGPAQESGVNVLVISSAVQDPQSLQNAAKDGVKTVFYDANSTSLTELSQKIANALNGQKADSIAFAAEGNDNVLMLNTDIMVSDNIQSNIQNHDISGFWKTIGGLLNNGGRIDLLACDVAGDSGGQSLVAQIDQLIDRPQDGFFATVAASTDLTGNAAGGDWLLEVGNIDAKSIYFNDSINNWNHNMATAIEYGLIAALIGALLQPRETLEDTSLSFSYASSGTVFANPDFSFTLLTNSINGNTTVTEDGNVTYTPNADYNNPGFTLGGTINDGVSFDSATIRIVDTNPDDPNSVFAINLPLYLRVVSVNDAPIAQNDSFSIGQGNELTGNVALNDSDFQNGAPSENNTPLTVQLVSGPAHAASFTLNADGTFSYTSIGSYSGADSFTYSITDSLGGVSEANVALSVISNAPPAVSDNYIINEDTTLNGNVTDNDTFNLGANQTIQLVSGPLVAANFALNSDGSFSYTPLANLVGVDTFSYVIKTVSGAGITFSNTATVNIAVLPVNDNPVAINDNYNVNEDGSLAANVLNNDTDIENNRPFSAQLVAGPAHAGSFTLNADGTFSYIPTADYNGSDSFTYVTVDSLGAISNLATVSIAVASINDAPVAQDVSYNTNEDTPLTGILGVGSDSQNGAPNESNTPLTAQLIGGPAHASAFTLNADGSFSYNPQADFNGTDSFTYAIVDSLGAISNTATVSITIDSVNDAPIAQNDAFQGNEDGSINGSVLLNDSDNQNGAPNENNSPLSAQLVTGPAHAGSFTLNADGTFTYIPSADYNGSDSFTYVTLDSLGGISNLATVSITINSVNDAPIAQNDSYQVNEDNGLNGNVALNDSDSQNGAPSENNGPLSAQLVTGPAHAGSFTLNADGTFSYIPAANYNGADSFTYVIVDSLGATSNIATVAITINSVNDAPIVQNDSFNIPGNLPYSGNVLTNDSDNQGGAPNENNIPLSAQLVNGPAHATSFILNADGTFSYQPANGFVGSDTFTYRVTDSLGGTSTIATVTITVAQAASANPILELKGNINKNYIENSGPVILSNNVKITDSDSSNFDGGKLTVQIDQNGQSSDILSIDNSTKVKTNANQDIYYNGLLVGHYTGGSGLASLEITFNANATANVVSEVAERIAYKNSSENPSTADRSIRYQLSDGDSGISEAQYKIVRVFSVNDAPDISIADNTLTVNRGSITNIGALSGIQISDVDASAGDRVRVVLKVLVGYLDFTDDLNDLTSIIFKRNPGDGLGSLDFTGTLADVNAALERLTYRSRTNYIGLDALTVGVSDMGSSGTFAIPRIDADWLLLKIV
ncbi:Ig-like domain-containing protein [Criblamydia sequanensis]|uniref:Cadherin domain-containing protein n=1 Tax=Candidatus Criblamydia sequanensis CRIB-18 TaxID=1437425 RepID=A0A090D0P9_9BACT|nr:Ig-like domain-containing protein [Criblamydia sequanensis]CDR33148.1 hypothetical protein CSEC_0309 [Criblamydia sequanensis CRIB-18]